MEKYKGMKTDLHMVFIDLEIVFDRVPREIIWLVLEKKVVTMDVMSDIYDVVGTTIRSITYTRHK